VKREREREREREEERKESQHRFFVVPDLLWLFTIEVRWISGPKNERKEIE